MKDLKGAYKAVQALADAIKASIETEGTKNIEDMKKGMLKLLHLLSSNYDVFDVDNFLSCLNEYIKNYKRLLYSQVTVYVYEVSKTDKLATVMSNLEKVCNEVVQNDNELEKEETKIALKLLDHVNLASNQIDSLQMNEKKFAKQAEPIITQLENTNKDLEDIKKNHMGQLISIVAIFTALSFISVGGFNTISTIFNDLHNAPLTRLVVLGSLSALVLFNILFFFFYFISKITGMDISAVKDNRASIIVKYPLFFVMNIIFFSIFLSSFLISFMC